MFHLEMIYNKYFVIPKPVFDVFHRLVVYKNTSPFRVIKKLQCQTLHNL